MSRIFFASELEGVATWWRIERRDGVTLGFTSHDRDLYFDGVLHRAAPGILPSAIRKTAGLDGESAELQGPLSHASISARDLASGKFDEARVRIGAIDWETKEPAQIFAGLIGSVAGDDDTFTADLLSAKHYIQVDPVPRSSPTCRATFCGPGCTLSGARFTQETKVLEIDLEMNAIRCDTAVPANYAFGQVRWIDGPHVGDTMEVISLQADWLVLDTPLDPVLASGARIRLREGCDHTIETCRTRFANAFNFQGEPFLPGNDLLARYPTAP